jgi:hypothetical protein
MMGFSLFAKASTKPPIQCKPGALTVGLRRPEPEGYHSSPCSAEIKSALVSTSNISVYLHGVVLN